jgi:SulP family sulfate permease
LIAGVVLLLLVVYASGWVSRIPMAALVAVMIMVSIGTDEADGTRVYEVKGQVFFADATQFANSFDYLHTPKKVVIDLTHAHFWDLSAVGALDRVVLKLRAHGAEVDVVGLNEASDTLIERLGKHRDEDANLSAGH